MRNLRRFRPDRNWRWKIGPGDCQRCITATHATKGVVKGITSSAITITRVTAGKRVDTSFQLTSSTQRAGAIAAGVTVEIRYRTEGKQRIATAINVEAPPQ